MKNKKEWGMPLFPNSYQGISSSIKSVEGRVPDFTKTEKDYRTMRVGDVLNFYLVNEDFSKNNEFPEVKFEVKYVHHYTTVGIC